MAGELWVVSAPGGDSTERTFQRLQVHIQAHAGCQKFSIPDLKVGTLDSLVAMSDQLAKIDPYIEGLVHKIVKYIHGILDPEDQPNFLDGLSIGPNKYTMDAYVTRFQWDNARFPPKQPIPNLVDIISKIANDMDVEFKRKTASYNNARVQLQAMERKAVGNLMTRSLNDVVTGDDVVSGSEYLQTLLVVVPKSLYREWEKSYETISEMIVPRSSRKVAEDAEYGLWTVTLFRKKVEEFKNTARDRKFIVRDFEYDPKAVKAEREAKKRLKDELKKQFPPLMNWLKINFAVAFSAWIHLKALRTFVESVLRYGLPVNFQAAVVRPYKSQKKVQSLLNQLYEELDTQFDIGKDEEQIDLPGIVTQDYHPYVFFKIGLDMVPK